MNKDTTDGDVEQVKGSVKEALGKVIGNENLEAEGASEKAVGRARKDLGQARKAAEDAARKTTG
ncbi:CsbD family protein [Variovorax sp. PvP013]|jgi:uncharacterized protein YjbJ (UPF0337 family)|uniref:CsbD family protein n=1 Tax=Variovorax sp. PvP013 TaxID=3156435 RepID=UPI003D22A339